MTLVNRLLTKGSYFANCPRDEHGRCVPANNLEISDQDKPSGSEPASPNKPKLRKPANHLKPSTKPARHGHHDVETEDGAQSLGVFGPTTADVVKEAVEAEFSLNVKSRDMDEQVELFTTVDNDQLPEVRAFARGVDCGLAKASA